MCYLLIIDGPKPLEALKVMSIGPSELTIVLLLVLILYVAVPALLIFVVILFYRRLKEIEEHLQSIEEKIGGASGTESSGG